MIAIPAIDLIDGKCVRLTKGDYAQKKVYAEDPLEVARTFEAAGIKHLHLVDLDGARSGHVVNLPVLENIARNTQLKIDFGGGVKADKDLEAVFSAGAAQVTAGSIAVKSPETVWRWLETHGPEKIILGADVMHEKIAISGWQENSGIALFDFLENYRKRGVVYVVCTDIEKDGMMQGSSIALYRKILSHFPDLKLIASGGVNAPEELAELHRAGVHGAIVGKAVYEGRISLHQIAHYQ